MATAPTTKEISEIIIAQLEASLNQTIPLLPKSFNRVLAKAIAAVFTLLYKYAGFIFLQVFVKTATLNTTEINGTQVSPLTAWGVLIGTGEPDAATNAELNVSIEVTNETGTLASGAQLLGASNGITYITTGAVNLDAPTVSVGVQAVGDQNGGNGAGAIGNLEIGETLSFANPLPNIGGTATVTSIVVTAANAEAVEVYRQRVIDRFQKRPQGGAYSDYELWSEGEEGIVNAYPYTSTCPGQVDVYVEATVASSGSPDGIPTDAQLQQVLDAINLDENGLASRRPANALANVFPITRTGFRVLVTGLEVNDAAAVQASIIEDVSEYMLGRDIFIPGLSIPPRLDRITTTGIGGLVEDIVSAAGGIFTGVNVFVSGPSLDASVYSSESADVSAQEGAPTGFAWRDDGTSFVVVGSNGFVYEYTVSTAFDLASTVAYSGNSVDLTTEDVTPEAVRWSADGFKFFILGAANTKVFEYNTTVPYSLSGTTTYLGSNFDVSAQDAAPHGLDFSEDGKKFFVTGDTGYVYEYTVSNAFDLSSTVAYSGNRVLVPNEETAPKSVFFTDRGSIMSIIGDEAKVFQYVLSVPYGFGTTVTARGLGFDVSSEEAAPESFAYSADQSKFFVLGAGAELFQYTSGVGELLINTYTLGEGEKAKSLGVTFS